MEPIFDVSRSRQLLSKAHLVSQHWIENERVNLYRDLQGSWWSEFQPVEGPDEAYCPRYALYRLPGPPPSPSDLAFLERYPAEAPPQIECDGMARILHWALAKAGIAHRFMVGRIESDYGYAGLHYWIGLMDGLIVDYSLTRWLEKHEDVPVGVFAPETQRKVVRYWGLEQPEEPLPDLLIEALMQPLPPEANAWFGEG